ncbi:MAG: hypothetical protein MUC58_02140 [Rhizobiaceae bacterium]|nr:hypothetical protein [Rhizobiaceae bacterium]
MPRVVSVSVLLFWVAAFGALAHMALVVPGGAIGTSAEGRFLAWLAMQGGSQLVTVLCVLVASLFLWAALSVAFGDAEEFRAVEGHAYAGGILAMAVAVIGGALTLAMLLVVPTIITASLAASAAASHVLPVGRDPLDGWDISRATARRMAMSAAHNSMLSRLAGRGSHTKPTLLKPTHPRG